VSRPAYGGVPFDDFVAVSATSFETGGLHGIYTLGAGKVASAVALYSYLLQAEARRGVRGVLLCGIAGAYPERHRTSPPPVRLGSVCIVGSDAFADEGVDTPQGFVDFGSPVFGHGQRLVDTGPFGAHARIAADAASRLGAPIVRGATVSTCSGTDALSSRLHERTSADVETMEGAAVAFVCRQRELPLLHVRAISNWTGDRHRGEWNLGVAADALARAVRLLSSDVK
jgi:futalosine hydrolase